MGQMQAAGLYSPPPPPETAPPAPSSPVKDDAQPAKVDKIENPGDLETLNKRAKDLLPQPFDGCKLVLNKGLSQFFQTSHTIQLGSNIQPAQYQFGATYVGSRQISDREYRPVMMGEMSSNGSLVGMFIHQLGSNNNWRLKCNVQTDKSKWVVYQSTLDYLGSDYTASLTLGNPNLFQNTGVLVLQYLQSVTAKLSLGAEVLFQKMPGMEFSVLSLAANYRGTDWEAIGKVGMHQWSLCYLHRATDDLALVAEFEGVPMQGESILSVGYKYDLPKANASFKGVVDTQWNVSCMVEKRLDPLPATLTLSALINHVSDKARLGIGFSLG